MTTVLLALGDSALRDACNAELHAAGHATLVLDRPLAALSLASKVSWEVVLVDDTSFGRDALRTVGSDARVVGLGAGTVGVKEALPLPLQAHGLIDALTRTCPPPAQVGLTLDSQRRLALANGAEVLLTRTEFRLLEVLQERSPSDVSLEQLLDSVWGTAEGIGTAELVRTHVRNLRQKLSQVGLPDAVRSHRGRGYALET
jgi:DNA-binding response OmpR family regulator